MMICHTKNKHELMVNPYCRAVKKKVVVETTDCTKRAGKVFKRPPQMSKSETTTAGLLNRLGRIALSNVEYTSSRIRELRWFFTWV